MGGAVLYIPLGLHWQAGLHAGLVEMSSFACPVLTSAIMDGRPGQPRAENNLGYLDLQQKSRVADSVLCAGQLGPVLRQVPVRCCGQRALIGAGV